MNEPKDDTQADTHVLSTNGHKWTAKVVRTQARITLALDSDHGGPMDEDLPQLMAWLQCILPLPIQGESRPILFAYQKRGICFVQPPGGPGLAWWRSPSPGQKPEN